MIVDAPIIQQNSAVADSLARVTKKFQALPDSLSTMTPEKLHEGIKNFNWNEVISQLTDTGVSLALRSAAAVLVFLVGRFVITRLYHLLLSVMVGRNVDRSLTTFLLSLFRMTFFFLLLIIVISILGIETSSFIAIFASAGIAIGMAFSGTLQNFAGGVLILMLKPYKVGDYIEHDKYKGTVKEIQIFHTIITTYNNESIIIPNGMLSTGTVNNYSRELVRRLEWRVAISYGDDVDVARKTLLGIIAANEQLLKHGTEEEHNAPIIDENDDEKPTGNKAPWYVRWLGINKKLQQTAAQWRKERKKAIRDNMPQLNFTPSVNVESLDDSAVTLVVRAWVKHADYWQAFYDINEAIYKQLPQHGIHFPFPQMDVHLNNENKQDQ